MEVNKSDISKYIGLINLHYPNTWKFASVDEKSLLIESWYNLLKDYSKELIETALGQAIKKSRFAPTVADITESIDAMLQAAYGKSDTQLWSELETALIAADRWVYILGMPNAVSQRGEATERVNSLFNNLDPVLREYVADIDGFIRFAQMDVQDLDLFEKGRFLKLLPTLRSRVKTQTELNASGLLTGGALKQIGG